MTKREYDRFGRPVPIRGKCKDCGKTYYEFTYKGFLRCPSCYGIGTIEADRKEPQE